MFRSVALRYLSNATNCSDKRAKGVLLPTFNYVYYIPLTAGICKPIQKYYSPGQKAFSHSSSKSQKLHARVLLSGEKNWDLNLP